MALRHTGIGVQEIADRLQVSRNAVSSWINGRHKPRRRDLVAFAMATGYPVRWLETGEAPPQDDPGTGLHALPGLDSNQEPAG
ncbi:helix-turn-helix domain-containing protein [Microbacterium suwonense]